MVIKLIQLYFLYVCFDHYWSIKVDKKHELISCGRIKLVNICVISIEAYGEKNEVIVHDPSYYFL